MSNSNYIYTQTRPATEALALDSDQVITVNCDGFDTLFLQIDYTNDAGTALTFSFADAAGVNDSANPYTKAKVNYSTNAIEFAPGFSGSVSGDVQATIPFSLTGIGLAGAGNVEITISCASASADDTIVVTPILARTV